GQDRGTGPARRAGQDLVHLSSARRDAAGRSVTTRRAEQARGRYRLGAAPIHRWTLGYALAPAGLRARRVPMASLPTFLVVHGLLVTLAVVMPRARRSGSVGQFMGDWYPLLILMVLYTEV